MTYRVLSLFAGIGGFDLGLERTGGFKTVAFCEIDPFCRRVLAKHWPEVPCYEDVRGLTAERLAADGIAVDCIVGGFPCQDISTAGRGEGIEGARSGLWTEYARIIREIRPRYVIVENVSALLSRGLYRVLGDMAEIGYDAWWDGIPAVALGAHHRRDRIWVVAHPSGECRDGRWARPELARRDESANGGEAVADAISLGQSRQGPLGNAGDPEEAREGQATDALDGCLGSIWATEPPVGRVAHGVPARVDRLRCLGNAVVPQIPELIGRAILAMDAERLAA